jgi:hypothetical protein
LLKEKYENIEEKQGLINNRLQEIKLSHQTIMLDLNRKEPKLMELGAKTKRLSMLTTELEGLISKQSSFSVKQQSKIINRQITDIENIIKNIKPQLIYQWQQKIENDYQFLQSAKRMPQLNPRTISEIQFISKNTEELKDRVNRAKINLAKDISIYKKIKIKLIKFNIEINQR